MIYSCVLVTTSAKCLDWVLIQESCIQWLLLQGMLHLPMSRRGDQGCVSPKLLNVQPKLSIGQETTRERTCVSVCWFPATRSFPCSFFLWNSFKLVFLMFYFFEHQELTFWAFFFCFASQLHNAAPCRRSLSVVQSWLFGSAEWGCGELVPVQR